MSLRLAKEIGLNWYVSRNLYKFHWIYSKWWPVVRYVVKSFNLFHTRLQDFLHFTPKEMVSPIIKKCFTVFLNIYIYELLKYIICQNDFEIFSYKKTANNMQMKNRIKNKFYTKSMLKLTKIQSSHVEFCIRH